METTDLTAPPRDAAEPALEGLDEIVPIVDVVAVAGPPVLFIAGPWLLFGLMLAAPFAVIVALAGVLVLATLAVAAIGALLASPYLLVRHLHQRIPRPAPASPAVTLSAGRAWPAGA